MMADDYEAGLLKYLQGFMTPERLNKMDLVLGMRTRYLTVVVEDLFQPHNASAILRTSDAFGLQDVHIIEHKNTYKPNDEIALGSAQWLSLNHYKGAKAVESCYSKLKNSGYRIVATSPHKKAKSLYDLDLKAGPLAIVLGTELTGLSDYALANASEYLYVPMHGFVESFNISVCAALIMQELSVKLRASDLGWQLSTREIEQIRLEWAKKSVKRSAVLEAEYAKVFARTVEAT